MLEVLDRAPRSASDKPPILFVHGAWHGAWCWDEHFLDYFAEKGYRSVALSLRGHGNSTAPKSMRFCSIADFVDDIDTVAKSLPEPPVVIGHSLGGFVVQKYLESHEAPAAVVLNCNVVVVAAPLTPTTLAVTRVVTHGAAESSPALARLT